MARKSIPGIAEVDLPWTKLKERGVASLKDEELLAVVPNTVYGDKNVLDVSSEVLRKCPLSSLLEMDREQLRKIKGITASKADILLAAFEIARRALNQGMGILPSISGPADVLPIVADIKDKKKEHFLAVFLNARNQVICRETVSVGSLNASLVHPREIFAPAVGSAAASVILCHNHPSGDCSPSREDIDLTRRIVQAGEIMGIEIMDHLIVSADRFLSLKEANIF